MPGLPYRHVPERDDCRVAYGVLGKAGVTHRPPPHKRFQRQPQTSNVNLNAGVRGDWRWSALGLNSTLSPVVRPIGKLQGRGRVGGHATLSSFTGNTTRWKGGLKGRVIKRFVLRVRTCTCSTALRDEYVCLINVRSCSFPFVLLHRFVSSDEVRRRTLLCPRCLDSSCGRHSATPRRWRARRQRFGSGRRRQV